MPPSSTILPTANENWLTGQLLVAMPGMPDPRFARTVVYICSHGPNGAMGLIVNRLFADADFPSLLQQLNIESSPETPPVSIFFGGPVEPGRGFVLHSTDCIREGTLRIDETVALSATIDILRIIAEGDGPERKLMALGYSGWGAGQLENELKANGWLTVPADDDLLFDDNPDNKWERALAKIGISPLLLSADAGHA
jgi:putative transcriptional regulator